MKKIRTLTTIQILYMLIFCAALLLRLVNLNNPPLSENEAHHVLCAVDIQRAGCEGESNLYGFITNVLFHLFGQSNFASRLLPAIAGSLLALLPLMFENHFNNKTGLVLALCLALDPILIQVSRSADATMIAVAFILYMVVFIIKQDHKTIFVLFLFGMLSGPAFWVGLFLLVCSFGVTRYYAARKKEDLAENTMLKCLLNKETKNYYPDMVIIMLWITISTHFFTYLTGLLSPVQTIAALITGTWQFAAGIMIPAGIKLSGLVLYTAFGICLCISALIKGRTSLSGKQIFLIVWLILGLTILLLPGIPFSQSVWMLVPLWIFAAGEIVQLSGRVFTERKRLLIPSLLGITILIYLSLQIVRLRYLLSVGMNFQDNIYLLFIPLLLVVLFLFLYAYGWSGKLARQVVTVLFLICGFFGLWRNANRAANLTDTGEYELLQQEVFIHNADVLINELEQYRITQGAFKEDIRIALAPSNRMESLEWLLREYNVAAIKELPQTNNHDYDVIIVEGENPLEYTESYKQSMALVSNVKIFKGDYSGFLPKEILEWIIYRRGTLELHNFTLWFKF